MSRLDQVRAAASALPEGAADAAVLPEVTRAAVVPRPRATPDRTLHMVGNAHLDPVWLWPWQEGYAEARATFWSAIHRMDEYPDFVFTCDQVALLAWVEESDPGLFDRIRARVAEGRWQMVGGWWVEPDCNLPMGESFVRQGLLGQRWLADRFGVTATVGMNADPFGHHVMLPAILRGQGMDSYVFLRPGPHESDLDATAFWWEAPDGSRVLAYRIPFEYCSGAGPVDGQVDKALGAADRSLGDLMVFYGVGNHGGGPTRANIDSIHRYDAMGSFGRLVMSHPRAFLDGLAERDASGVGPALPVWRADLQHHAAGCYSAHSGIKAWQRRAQWAVLTAERWAAVGAAWQAMTPPRADLTRAWEQVLLNQFHDVLPGSAIEPAYDDARDQLGEAVAIAKRITTRVHNVVARQVDVPFEEGTQPVLVLNPHPWAVRTQVELQYGGLPAGVHVVDDAGRPVVSQPVQSVATTADRGRGAQAFEVDVPGLGYRLYRLRPGPGPVGAPEVATASGRASATAPGTTGTTGATAPGARVLATRHGDGPAVLENDVLRVVVDPATGWLSSLLDKRTGVDLAAGAGGPHAVVTPDPTDTWGHRVVSYAWPGEDMPVTRVVVREAGPLRGRVRIERAWGRSTLAEELLLGHGADQLEVRVTLDWREPGHLLKLRFPVAVDEPRATYEVPFAAIERPVDGAEEPVQSWVDLAGVPCVTDAPSVGLAVVTDGKHAADVSPGGPGGGPADPGWVAPSIGLTVVRSPVFAWHDPRELDPDSVHTHQDQGVQTFRYLLVPHAGDWRDVGLARRAAVLGRPVRAMLESSHPGTLPPVATLVDDGGGDVMVTALKPAEDPADPADGVDGDVVVRAVETTGRPGHVRIELPMVGRVVAADFGPHQIRTFRVPWDPGRPVVEVDLVERPLARAEGAGADGVGADGVGAGGVSGPLGGAS